MKPIIICLLSLSTLLGSTFAETSPYVATIQRHRFVAGSKDGTRVAILLSHFGPSSQAPFANLVIKEAGKSVPLLFESRSFFEGGETELLYLESKIIEESKKKMEDLGLVIGEIPNEVPVQWATKLSTLVEGNIDLKMESKQMAPFAISKFPDAGCAKTDPGRLNWQLSFQGKNASSQMEPWTCWTTAIELRNVYRSKDTVWFLVERTVAPFEGMLSYWVDFLGASAK